MSDIEELFNLNPVDTKKLTNNVSIVRTEDGLFVIKELTLFEYENIKYLRNHKTKALLPVSVKQLENKYYALYPYLKNDPATKEKAIRLLEALDNLHQNTKEDVLVSKMDIFKIKKIIMVMSSNFNSLELQIREIELSNYKDNNSWIILSKYHIILQMKTRIYKVLKKIMQEAEKDITLSYSFLHSYPTLEHFKSGYLLSFPYSKIGYYVNDLYKCYLDIEFLDFDYKKAFDKYLKTAFDKRYFYFMVLYSNTLSLKELRLNTYEGMVKYINITKKIAKFLAIFKEYE